MNPSKISGCCGRLMCCLMYEQDAYSSARRGLPKLKAEITTPDGRGKVVGVDTLKEQVKVVLDDDPDREVRIYTKIDLGIKPQETMAERLGEDESDWPDLDQDDDTLAFLEDESIDLDAIFEDLDMPDQHTKPGSKRAKEDRNQSGERSRRSKSRSSKKKSRRLGRPAEEGFIPHPVKAKKSDDSDRSDKRSNRSGKQGQRGRSGKGKDGESTKSRRQTKKRRSGRRKKRPRKSGPESGFRPVERKRK